MASSYLDSADTSTLGLAGSYEASSVKRPLYEGSREASEALTVTQPLMQSGRRTPMQRGQRGGRGLLRQPRLRVAGGRFSRRVRRSRPVGPSPGPSGRFGLQARVPRPFLISPSLCAAPQGCCQNKELMLIRAYCQLQVPATRPALQSRLSSARRARRPDSSATGST